MHFLKNPILFQDRPKKKTTHTPEFRAVITGFSGQFYGILFKEIKIFTIVKCHVVKNVTESSEIITIYKNT